MILNSVFVFRLGYEGTFIKRTFEKNDEGCATFFKSCKFTLQDRVVYKFGEITEKVLHNLYDNSRNHVVRILLLGKNRFFNKLFSCICCRYWQMRGEIHPKVIHGSLSGVTLPW
jgi:hypothetical protein